MEQKIIIVPRNQGKMPRVGVYWPVQSILTDEKYWILIKRIGKKSYQADTINVQVFGDIVHDDPATLPGTKPVKEG